MVEQGKVLLGISAVTFLTDRIMRIPPASFDKKRFAPVVSLVLSIVFSIVEALAAGSMDIWSAFIRGMGVAMGASGAHSVQKNYKELRNGKKQDESAEGKE